MDTKQPDIRLMATRLNLMEEMLEKQQADIKLIKNILSEMLTALETLEKRVILSKH